MPKPFVQQPTVKAVGLAFFGIVAVVITANMVLGQAADRQDDIKDKFGGEYRDPASRRRIKKWSLIRAGYTRPGAPNDSYRNGKLVSRVLEPKKVGERIIGATVYFAVYERPSFDVEGDIYGTGITGFDTKFHEGRATNGLYSPAYDTKARYLYLYQVVNDRGLDPSPTGISLAMDKELLTEDIMTTTVNLQVGPEALTSWGYFEDTGFVAVVPNCTFNNEIVPTKFTSNNGDLELAFSSNPSILAQLPEHEYKSKSPAMALGDLERAFSLARSNLNLEKTSAYLQLTKLAKPVAWQSNMLQSAKGGKRPDYVQVLVPSETAQYVQPAADAFGNYYLDKSSNPKAVFKVDWRGQHLVKPAEHSVVYGFTSNMPPMDEEAKIFSPPGDPRRIPEAALQRTGSAFVSTSSATDDDQFVVQAQGEAQGAAQGQMVAPGTVPTPDPNAGGSGGGAGGVGSWMGGLGVGIGTGGVGFPGRGFGAGTGFGTAPNSGLAGSGGALAGSGGNPAQAQQGTNNNTPTNNTPSDNTGQQNQSNTLNAILINQQAQAQLQAQFQNQQQHQRQNQQQNNNNHHGQVVPEPAALALALLGLPALYVVVRRRKGADTPKPVQA
jgi:hypothetical protein